MSLFTKHPQRSKTISLSKPSIIKVKVLGIGAFAKVELVTKDGEEFALKSGEVDKEYEIMKELKHPNIVICFQYIHMGNIGGLLLEFIRGGDLFALIAFHFHLMEPMWIRSIMQDICCAISYLHAKGISHRDLKLENILLYSTSCIGSNPPKYPFRVKICDFGLATFENKSMEHCGSKEYAAPELILQQDYIPKKVDMWAIGVIWYACCCGQLPFGNPETLVKQVMRKRKKMEFLIADIQYEFIESSKLLNDVIIHGIKQLMCHKDKRWDIQTLCTYLSE